MHKCKASKEPTSARRQSSDPESRNTRFRCRKCNEEFSSKSEMISHSWKEHRSLGGSSSEDSPARELPLARSQSDSGSNVRSDVHTSPAGLTSQQYMEPNPLTAEGGKKYLIGVFKDKSPKEMKSCKANLVDFMNSKISTKDFLSSLDYQPGLTALMETGLTYFKQEIFKR